MTPHQVKLVQASWAAVVPIQDTAARLFYDHLFTLDPTLRALFPEDLAAQYNKLVQALNFIVMSLDDLEVLLPMAEKLAKRHVTYGVEAKDYDTVGTALLWTLGQGLGPAFTAETREAWATAYAALIKVMKDAAHND